MMAAASKKVLRRALLYVPASSPKMLRKSLPLSLMCDNITYDLEDSVLPDLKPEARNALRDHLTQDLTGFKQRGELAVRINSVGTPYIDEDIAAFAPLPSVGAIVVPKVNSAADLEYVTQALAHHAAYRDSPPKILALIESARAVMNLREICTTSPELLDGLIFAAEDFSLDTCIRRSNDLHELLFARSAIVTAGRAAKLTSIIDFVCIAYAAKGRRKALQNEVLDAKYMGFTGKQCIHPDQIGRVQSVFVPSPDQLEWAVRVTIGNEKAVAAGLGAWSFQGVMVDRPVVLRAEAILEEAKQCNLNVKRIREKWIDQEPKAHHHDSL
ncbi:beta subunit of citrate lyase [Annulohypoxylon stygium]|nr:beta subunit of citrate lyase [Annulohypoxylon stygium]